MTSHKIKGQDNTYNKRGPKAWLLYGSNDGTNWSIVDDKNASSSDHQTGWTSNQERTFASVDAAGDYKYYKFQFTQAEAADTYLGFREIDLIGVDYSPISDFNLAITLDENNATFKAAALGTPLSAQRRRFTLFNPVRVPNPSMTLPVGISPESQSFGYRYPVWYENDKIIMRLGNANAATPSYVTMDLLGQIISVVSS